MPPPKQACETILNTQIAATKVIKRVREISEKIKTILKNKANLKYGIINLLDVIGAETITAISAVSASVAKSILSSVSGMASTLLESVFNLILKILLANPTAVFSLVAIPHSQAKIATSDERKYLKEARINMRLIMFIILKWTDGVGGANYYRQMKDALPYIQAAIALSIDIINGLEGDPTEDGEVRNAVFNESKYRDMQRNIDNAMSITKPDSVIDNKFQITKKVESNRRKHYKKLERKIEADYKKRRDDLSDWYSKKMGNFTDENESITTTLLMEEVQNEYALRRQILDTEKKEKLYIAQADAAAKSFVDKSAYINAAGDIASEFSNDIQALGISLLEFVDNAKNAYRAYKRSQNLCNVIYKIRDIITNLIDEIIDLIRRSSNVTANAAIASIETAQSIIEVAEDGFSDAISRYENASEKISSIELAKEVMSGYGLIATADSILNGAVTQSLIDLINSDDVLDDANGEFEKFYTALIEIPDWDGRLGVWAVSPTDSAISPYVQLIADATSMLAKVPALALSNDKDDRDEVSKVLKRLNNTFKTLFGHNSVVSSTLNSYYPYMSSEAGNLTRILSSAGLIENFATTLSIAALTSDIVVSIKKGGLDDTMPTYENCRSEYPDLYKSAEAAEAAALGNANIRPSEIDLNYIQQIESKEIQIIGTSAYIKSFNFNSILTDDSFQGPVEEVS